MPEHSSEHPRLGGSELSSGPPQGPRERAAPVERGAEPDDPAESPIGAEDAAELETIQRRVLRWWHPVLGLALVGLLIWSGVLDGVSGEVQKQIQTWRDAIEHFGPVLGPVLFTLAYAVLTMLWFPASILTAAAGAMFGSGVGVVTSMVGSMIAAVLSFLIARHWARQRVNVWLRSSQRFQKLNRMTGRHGGLIVFVVRAMNLFPFAMVNYGFGLTRVELGSYVLWSFVGRLAGTVVLVVLADVLIRAVIEGQVPWALVAVAVFTAALLAVVVGYLNRRLRAADEAVVGPPAERARSRGGPDPRAR